MQPEMLLGKWAILLGTQALRFGRIDCKLEYKKGELDNKQSVVPQILYALGLEYHIHVSRFVVGVVNDLSCVELTTAFRVSKLVPPTSS